MQAEEIRHRASLKFFQREVGCDLALNKVGRIPILTILDVEDSHARVLVWMPKSTRHDEFEYHCGRREAAVRCQYPVGTCRIRVGKRLPVARCSDPDLRVVIIANLQGS